MRIHSKLLEVPLWVFSAITTLVILALPLDGIFKAGLFVLSWFILLSPILWLEVLGFFVTNIQIMIMESQNFKKGFFYFTHPDLCGFPYWEFFMWGYLSVFFSRVAGNVNFRWISVPYAILYSLSFQFITDQKTLFFSTLIIVVLMMISFKRSALIVGIFAVFYGIIFEQIGYFTHQWNYSEPNAILNFPLWSLTMWAGSMILFSHFLFPALRGLFGRKP